jgi:hypothetical protein
MLAAKTAALAVAFALCLCAVAPMGAQAKVLSIDDHLAVEEGSTNEWDGGDYVAINMTKGDSLAWFGVVYGNETHGNSITLVSAYIRFLGGCEVRNSDGAMMIPATGIPVLTIYIQKLFALIEFGDDGYLDPWRNETIGAGNGLFDFENTGDGLSDFGIGSVEPIYKLLDLNRSWERSNITEVRTLGTTEKEWEFTLSNKNLLYTKVWDNEPGTNDDGSRPGREPDGKLNDIEFTFHVGTRLAEYDVSVPWYRVTWEDGVVASEEVEPRIYNGTSLTTEFKFDHGLKGWDYADQENLLMLETGTAFGTFVPTFVQDWLDVQFVNSTGDDAAGVAELETFTGGEQDIRATDSIPSESQQLTKDTITFRDNWQKVGEMSWVSNVTVDNEDRQMHFQIHAGESFNWPGENNDGYVRGIIFLGGYIYPTGHDIFHDPSFVAHALFLPLGIGFDPFGTVLGIFITGNVCMLACGLAYVAYRRVGTMRK